MVFMLSYNMTQIMKIWQWNELEQEQWPPTKVAVNKNTHTKIPSLKPKILQIGENQLKFSVAICCYFNQV